MTDLVWFHDMEFTMMQLFEFKIAELAKMDADRMTPMEALSKLYELSSRVKIAKS